MKCEEPPLLITMRDVRAVKMCASGARIFAKRHNLNWSKFLAEGIPAEELIATGDEMAIALVKAAQNGRK